MFTSKSQKEQWDTLSYYIDKIKNKNQVQEEEKKEDSDSDGESYPQCKDCKIILMRNLQNNFQCKGCGLLIDNPNRLVESGFKSKPSFVFKTAEERHLRVQVQYVEMSQTARALLQQQKVEPLMIDQIIEQVDKLHKYIGHTIEPVMVKQYACILYEKVKERSLNITKRQVYDSYQVNSEIHAYYAKKISQGNMNVLNQPEPVKVNVKFDILDYNALYSILFIKMQKHSSCANIGIFNTIANYLDIGQGSKDADNTPLKNTTNSLVLECVALRPYWIKFSEGWMKFATSQFAPKELSEIRSKYFQITVSGKDSILKKCKTNGKSNLIMNTAINFQFKSIMTPEKTYTFKIFSQGKIVIAGVLSPYEQSEVNVLIQKFLRSFQQYNQSSKLEIDVVKVILSNYSTYLILPDNCLINIRQAYNNLNNREDELNDLCIQNNTRCISKKIINHRLYLNLNIHKRAMPFVIVNADSTASMKNHKSVQFIITQRGIVTIQGADDYLINTLHVKKVLYLIYQEFIKPVVYEVNTKVPTLFVEDQTELVAILDTIKTNSQETKDIITSIWYHFQSIHFHAEQGINVKLRLYVMINCLIKFINELSNDNHSYNHKFMPLSYQLEKQIGQSKKKMIQEDIPPKKHKLDICFECVNYQRKQLKIQPKHFTELMQYMLLVESLDNDFKSIISDLAKVFVKPVNK